MAKYDDIVEEGYREKQVGLRGQIAKLKGQIKRGTAEAGTAAVIQRAERQIADLEAPAVPHLYAGIVAGGE